MAIAAVGQVLAWGVETVAALLAAVTDEIVSRLGAVGLSPSSEERGPHLHTSDKDVDRLVDTLRAALP